MRLQSPRTALRCQYNASPFRFDGFDTIGVHVWRADGIQNLDIPGSASLTVLPSTSRWCRRSTDS
jgi:hypothetical protein